MNYAKNCILNFSVLRVYIIEMKTYKFRIYPTKTQKKVISNQLEICRHLYNKTLEYKINKYKEDKTSVSLYDLNKLLTKWKKENQEYNLVYSQALQSVQERIDLAFKSFFQRLKKGQAGFPRFKPVGRIRSITYKQAGFKISNELELSKIGCIKIVKHRNILGNIKKITIVKYNSGKYFVCIITDYKEKLTNKSKKTVGIDLGIRTLCTCSDGFKVENPKFIKSFDKKIKCLSYRFSKNKTNKNKHSLSLCYEKLSNKREDFIHKTCNKLLKKYKTICIENLNINSMNSYSPINKSIRDVCWAKLTTILQYKALNADNVIILVNPTNTSKRCSVCGSLNDIDISETIYKCNCGNKINRDLNASRNIMRLGLESH